MSIAAETGRPVVVWGEGGGVGRGGAGSPAEQNTVRAGEGTLAENALRRGPRQQLDIYNNNNNNNNSAAI